MEYLSGDFERLFTSPAICLQQLRERRLVDQTMPRHCTLDRLADHPEWNAPVEKSAHGDFVGRVKDGAERAFFPRDFECEIQDAPEFFRIWRFKMKRLPLRPIHRSPDSRG